VWRSLSPKIALCSCTAFACEVEVCHLISNLIWPNDLHWGSEVWPTCTSGCFARAHSAKLIPEVVVSWPCNKRNFEFYKLSTFSTSGVPCTSIAAFAILYVYLCCTREHNVDTRYLGDVSAIAGCNQDAQEWTVAVFWQDTWSGCDVHLRGQSIKKPIFWNSEPRGARSMLAMVAMCSFILTWAASLHVN